MHLKKISNDKRNKQGRIPFLDMTHGSFAFLWRVSEGGYSVNNTLEIDPNQIDVDWIDQQPPWLVPEGKTLRQYPPLAEPTLHREFGDLGETEEAMMKFAGKYGLLGHDVILAQAKGSEVILGESVGRWKQEIQQMSVLLTIWDLVYDKMEGKLRQIVSWPSIDRITLELEWERANGRCEVYSPTKLKDWPSQTKGYSRGRIREVLSSPQHEPQLLERWRRGDVMEPALYYVCLQVNKRLRNQVCPQVLPFRGKEMRLFPDSLLSAMYLMFMWEIAGETKVLLCAGCGSWAEQKDPRQKHCSGACKQRVYRRRINLKEG
ncbi:hypothetical protein CMI37_23660 [Candidatus Pacearchaeota archaeon]|nr:hypothetical protein [Candidatus Pacearchaeota archaeon]|tara:strand:+ start:6531 stop:7487 length:957 start_codon:yes stop_codon:yes gene_type:complete